MINTYLIEAGFYEVRWPSAPELGSTFVRPGRRQSVRVFLPHNSQEVEVYAGDLLDSKLVYRGPAADAAQLSLLALHSN
ncbi:hypothetical protein [Hymenobacter koreensis]|uniref:Uncharacterized protein n=1 Tax=Hymenobacter koreensis TaxID=1084523 RepID=A0ABP8J0U4_9BACT